MRGPIPRHANRQAAFAPIGPSVRPVGHRALRQTTEVRRILGRSTVQPKLKVSAPNDPLEVEADRVADRVMRMPEPEAGLGTSWTAPGIQRLCAECGDELQRLSAPGGLQRQVEEEEEELLQPKRAEDQLLRQPEEEEEEELLQLKAEVSEPARVPTDSIVARGTGGGRPLDPGLRAFFEPRFGRSFAQVRVHTGAPAAASAEALGARAYTHGRDVVFGAGEYQPQSSEGRRLLAHELAHTVQQGQSGRRAGSAPDARQSGKPAQSLGGVQGDRRR